MFAGAHPSYRTRRAGQVDIVEAAVRYRERLFEATVANAEEAGVSLAFEDDDMEDMDEEDEADEEESEEDE